MPEVPDIYLQVTVFDDGSRRCLDALRNEDGFVEKVIQHRNILWPYFADDGHINLDFGYFLMNVSSVAGTSSSAL